MSTERGLALVIGDHSGDHYIAPLAVRPLGLCSPVETVVPGRRAAQAARAAARRGCTVVLTIGST